LVVNHHLSYDSAMLELKAGEHRCEEASMFSTTSYIPCNAPAEAIVHSKVDRRDYRMCAGCADHNVRNRGMEYVGPYVASGAAAPASR
jgi:hypothetical protein